MGDLSQLVGDDIFQVVGIFAGLVGRIFFFFFVVSVKFVPGNGRFVPVSGSKKFVSCSRKFLSLRGRFVLVGILF